MRFNETTLYNIMTNLQGIRWPLFDLASWKNGLAFKKIDFSETGLPVIKIAELNNGISTSTSYTQGIYDSNVFIKKGDLLFSWSGNPQTSIDVYKYRLLDGWLNQHIFKVTADEDKVTKDFLYYLLKYLKPHFTQIAANKQTTGLGHVTIADLKRMSVIVPNMEVQRKIVSIVKAIDDKIEINNEINKNLEQQARAIYLKMFATNKSVTHATIADVALNITDGVHNTVHDDPDGEYLLLSCKNIKGGHLTIGSNERTINKKVFDKLRQRTNLAKGDVLISSVGTVGELLLLNTVPSNYEFQRSVAIVKPNPAFVSSAYLFEALHAQRHRLINAAHGAVQQCLFISDIADFPICIPQQKDLIRFDELVTPMFDIITANEKECTYLTSLRDTLLPRLMSGELDVFNLEI